jgi:hypothetical protein
MGTKFVCVILFALAGFAAAVPASAAEGEIPASVRATLLSDALRIAAADGDASPYDIQAVATTKIQEVQMNPGTTAPLCESSPECAEAPVYVLAMRGHFACNTCSMPRGGRIGPGTVITLGFEAPTLFRSSFGFNSSYPDLQALGVPVRLGPEPLSAATLLAIARRAARSSGDAHPRDIEMASGSLPAATRVFDPTAMFYPSSPEVASETEYLIAMHGHFSPTRAPAGLRYSKRKPSPVLDLIVNEAGEIAASAYQRTVPISLSHLGPVTRLG